MLSKKTLSIPWFLLPGAKNFRKYLVALGFRGAKNISIYGVLLRESQKKRENTTYLTIFGHYETEKKVSGVTTTAVTVPLFLACEAPKTWKCQAFLPLVGPCAHHRHSQQRNDSKHLSLDSFVSLFLRFCCGDAFCTDTLLQTDDVTYRNLYTEQLLCADTYIYTLTQRGLCEDKLLHADAFTHRGFYAKKFYIVLHTQVLYTDALHKGAFTRINKRTQALLHTEPFTQRNLCTEQFLHKKLLHRKALIPKNLSTQTAQKKTPKLLRAETLPRAAFTHRTFSAQKPLRTEVFMHSSFYIGPFTHRCLYTENFYTESSAHSTLLHTTSFYTERLCFPFLITCVSCSPSQVQARSNITALLRRSWYNYV